MKRRRRESARVPGAGSRPRIMFVVNVDYFFLSHRLPLAKAVLEAGFDVWVAAKDTGRGGDIRKQGLGFVPYPVSRKGVNPLTEARTLIALIHLYRRLRPTLVHHVTIKPVVYGSLAARLAGVPAVVNAITGLGFSFSTEKGARIRRAFAVPLLRIALSTPRSRTILQNPDDLERFVNMRMLKPEHAVLIRGSGVDCERFFPGGQPTGDPLVMLASRMLWNKGVGEFVEAARIVRVRDPKVRFVLVGDVDEGNLACVPPAQLEGWVREGVVEWWGQRDDMPEVLRTASVVVLPTTYPEGVPKILLEAAASARPIVATDVPGCREIVRPGVNGILVPPRDTRRLAGAIIELLESPELRERFGRAGREIAVREFAESVVVRQTLEVYRQLLGDLWPGSPNQEAAWDG